MYLPIGNCRNVKTHNCKWRHQWRTLETRKTAKHTHRRMACLFHNVVWTHREPHATHDASNRSHYSDRVPHYRFTGE